jgi:hypothetical protein
MDRADSVPPDGCEPRPRWFGSDGHVKFRGLDGLDLPASGERLTDLGLRDAARPPPGRLLIAKAQQDVVATWPKDATKALDEGLTVLVIEHMKEAAVEDSVERLARRFQPTSVAHLEACACPSLAGLGFGQANGGSGNVDPDRVGPRPSCHQDMLTGTATHIEHPAAQAPLSGQRGKGGLWPTMSQGGVDA